MTEARLDGWDFSSDELNSAPSLINRQKSARNLLVVSLDRGQCVGTFVDPEKGIAGRATLAGCDCRDFLFVGKSPRKSFQPCKHIYRLAMELELLQPKYWDHEARESRRLLTLSQQKQREDARLQDLGRDGHAWGGWSPAVHESGLQRNRQYRAFFIIDDEAGSVSAVGSVWQVHGYDVRLEHCSCLDFIERHLPCKHIYAVALHQHEQISLTRDEYLAARSTGHDLVYEFHVERADPLSSL